MISNSQRSHHNPFTKRYFIKFSATFALCFLIPICLSFCKTTGNGIKSEATPEEVQEIRVGKALAARLIRKYGLLQKKDPVRYINLVGRGLARVSSRPELTFHFGILNTDEINAFACPGGYILLTRGALLVMQNEAELAGVLAHEISHVALEHSGRFQAAETSWLEFVGSMLGGGNVMNSAFHKATGELEKKMLENGRQKDLEFEADRAGLLYAGNLGYDPGAVIGYLRRTASAKNNKVMVKTHPGASKRIRSMEDFMGSEGLSREGALNKTRFQKYINKTSLSQK